MNTNRKGNVVVAKLKGKCVTGKIRYRDKQEAIEALHRAENTRKFSEQDGLATRRNEKRVYKCPSCAGAHLTSIETWYPVKEAA
jgi:hypothetical protein